MIGRTVSHYRIVGVLGSGGMGEVYAAVDETLGRRVALKAIRAERRLTPGARARFLREARILSQLDHPHICRVHDYVAGVDADFIVLELVEGRSLREAMARRMTQPECLQVAQQITAALVTAHGQGIVHRDLKPDNVMLTPVGSVKVLDFGLAASRAPAAAGGGGQPAGPSTTPGAMGGEDPMDAPADPEVTVLEAPADPELTALEGPEASGPALTMAGEVMGTLCYMSPEQARGESATLASDMFSLGLVLQELCTGTTAYPRDLPAPDLLRRVSRGETRSASTPDPHLTELIERLKSPVPVLRPSARETLERLRWMADKPRRRRRALLAGVLLLIALLFAVKYTVDLGRERSLAVAARDEADRRRGQAEELISFMLGDLRTRLEPVGRLDVLDEVGARATKYFAAVPEGALSDEELYRRSQALRQIGEVRAAQGSLDGAQEAFAESLRLASDLAVRARENGRWQVGLAASHFWLGSVAYYRSDFEAARHAFQEYMEIASRLVEREPENPEYRLELAYAHSNLGAVEESIGRYEAALRSFRQVLAIKERLAAEDASNPGRMLEVALAHNTIGVVLEKQGDLAGAIHEFRKDRALRGSLGERDPENMRWRNHVAISQLYLGNALRRIGELDAARTELEGAVRISESLTAQDPMNADWQRALAVARRQLSQARLEATALPEALALVAGATRILEDLVARDATNADWLRQLALARRVRAEALAAEGRLPEASRDAVESVELLRRLHETSPQDRRTRSELAYSQVALGDIQARAGDVAEAEASWRRAVDVTEAPADEQFGADLAAPLAMALVHLKRREEAQQVVETLRDTGFSDRDLLRVAQRGGLRVTR
jgi:eukaryotic-like serine/threonine-protein kinase